MAGEETTETTETVKGTEVEEQKPESVEKTEENTPEVFDADYVKGLRAEAAEWRTKLRKEEEERTALAKKVEEFEREKLSAEEKLKLEWEELRTENAALKNATQATRLEAAVAKNVKSFELADADATLKLLQGEVEFDTDGRPTNIEDVLTATLEKYPFLKEQPVKKSVVDPGATNPGRQKGGGTLTADAIRKMSHSERVARMDEINAWMANGYK